MLMFLDGFLGFLQAITRNVAVKLNAGDLSINAHVLLVYDFDLHHVRIISGVYRDVKGKPTKCRGRYRCHSLVDSWSRQQS